MIGSPSPAAIGRARTRVLGLTAVLSLVGLALVLQLALNARNLGDTLADLGAFAVAAVAVAGTALIVAMVPASLVAGAAGYAVGTVSGFAAASAAACAGAVVCAEVGRRVGTPAARYAFGARIARSVAFLDARPLRTVVLARLLPGMPFNAASYALGLTAIGRTAVAAGTFVGYAPRCFAYVALGGSLRDLGSPEARVALAASAVLLVLVVVLPRLVLRPTGPSPLEERPHG